METVLVSKTGISVYMADAIGGMTPTQEQGATAGLLSWLARRAREGAWRVVYHGKLHGTVPEGVTHVDPDTSKLSHQTPVEEHERRCREELERLLPYEPRVFLNVCGYSPSWSIRWNARGVRPQCTAARYCAPTLAPAGWLGLPRVVLNADLRCYPREGEMTEEWSSLVPCALMSQAGRDWPKGRVVAGARYAVREVDCGMENWHTEGRTRPRVDGPRDVDMMTMSHAHVKDGFGRYSGKIGRMRDETWERLLRSPEDIRPWLRDETTSVFYGEGWHRSRAYDPELMPGPVQPSQVEGELLRARMGLVVTPWGETPYVTSKVRYYAWAGAVPVMYGRTDGLGEWVPHAGDGLGRYVPLGHTTPYRAYDAQDVRECVEYWRKHDQDRRQWTDELERRTRPRFDRVEDCLTRLLSGEATDTEKWWKDFGGYRKG